jgi:hypothetical protein
MKLIIEEKQFIRVTAMLAETANNRSLLASRKSGVGSMFPKAAMMNNPMRFRSYELEKLGAEEADEETNFYIADNSDSQL